MICEKCNKNTATVHIVKIENGVKKQLILCKKCASNISDVNLTSKLEEIDGLNFQKIINELMGYITSSKKENEEINTRCNVCGTIYKDIKDKGILGCSECYNTFSNIIIPMIKRIQIDLEHIGRVPKKYGTNIIEKKKIRELKEELKNSIDIENYERAAEIRDEIKKLVEQIQEDENEKLD